MNIFYNSVDARLYGKLFMLPKYNFVHYYSDKRECHLLELKTVASLKLDTAFPVPNVCRAICFFDFMFKVATTFCYLESNINRLVDDDNIPTIKKVRSLEFVVLYFSEKFLLSHYITFFNPCNLF